jgi:hypothetical protein
VCSLLDGSAGSACCSAEVCRAGRLQQPQPVSLHTASCHSSPHSLSCPSVAMANSHAIMMPLALEEGWNRQGCNISSANKAYYYNCLWC